MKKGEKRKDGGRRRDIDTENGKREIERKVTVERMDERREERIVFFIILYVCVLPIIFPSPDFLLPTSSPLPLPPHSRKRFPYPG